ncbi:MAG: rhodanese-like domain-containing protein [Bacteroidota bacterium]|nr:rhodanese-like domain-containing protein [Bacteroidota bacterium]MDP4229463.1 rhodanese-like domain-containing protein [Bacteroidota bacterium]MDP4237781.1 rhodanese-like domain-containing protein [Bacteroidota bacterium]
MSEAEQVPVEDFLARRKANPKAIVIDVRDDDKWKEGHIPGAIHIEKSKVAEEIAAKVTDKNVEIFCHCGGGTSGPRAAALLNELGYKNAKAIKGGFRSYKASGEKIV